MKNITYLLHGNHPKAGKLKLRTIQIVKTIKQHGGKIEAKELEVAIGINRIEDPSLFYKPLAALRKWDLVQSHKKVVFDEAGKKHFVTTYELTPELFYHRLQKTLVETCKTELEMV